MNTTLTNSNDSINDDVGDAIGEQNWYQSIRLRRHMERPKDSLPAPR
jgi:hypothetical protein